MDYKIFYIFKKQFKNNSKKLIMFLTVLNNTNSSFEHRNKQCTEKYKSIKFESYFSTNTKFEYENGEIVVILESSVFVPTRMEYLDLDSDNIEPLLYISKISFFS